MEKRQQAYESIQHQTGVSEMRLGAEVALELDISMCDNIEKLAIEGTRLILLEPSYYRFHNLMVQDIYHLERNFGLKLVLAHIHRYVRLYSKDQLAQLMALNVVFQINADAFANKKECKFAKEILESGREFIFGSDCHNM